MLAVTKTRLSVQLIASLGSDIQPLALSPSTLHISKLEGGIKEPLTLFERVADAQCRPQCHGLSDMCHNGWAR